MTDPWKDKKILVTGAAGTVGQEIVRQLTVTGAAVIKGIGIGESAPPINDDRVSYSVCDIRDLDALEDAMQGCDVVFHCAALKYEDKCEQDPNAAIDINVYGTQNVIAAAKKLGVAKVLTTSSGKAIHPYGVYGATKLFGERLFQAANEDSPNTKFSVVRFCNVLGSEGSVIPIFKRQIQEGGPVTVTHNDMTRFGMSIEQAGKMIVKAAEQCTGGEIWVPKAFAWRIKDLAHVLIAELSPDKKIDIIETGLRPGEKLYDEMLSVEECPQVIDRKNFLVIMPKSFEQKSNNENIENLCVSSLSKYFNSAEADIAGTAFLLAFLQEHSLLKTDNDPHKNTTEQEQGVKKCA